MPILKKSLYLIGKSINRRTNCMVLRLIQEGTFEGTRIQLINSFVIGSYSKYFRMDRVG